MVAKAENKRQLQVVLLLFLLLCTASLKAYVTAREILQSLDYQSALER